MRILSPLVSVGAVVALLTGCGSAPAPQSAAPDAPQRSDAAADAPLRRFAAVVRDVQPVARQVCRSQAPDRNCDFLIVVDDRPGQPMNAFQTEDARGRPVLIFTLALIADARNADELAFVMGHEAAHHIDGHLAMTRSNAEYGAVLFGEIARSYGYSGRDLEAAAALGAELGIRSFAADYELSADSLGALIAARAGYNPVKGVAFFTRIPDPGDAFLSTHPPNAQRQANVQRVVAGLG